MREGYRTRVRRYDPAMALRVLFAALGTLFLGLGVLGAVLPILPTTPFVLLAAACYVRASPRLYSWLLGTRAFGPLIREWREHRSIPWRTKLFAIGMMAATLSASIVFFVEQRTAQVAMALFGVGLAAWLYRIPSRDRPATRRPTS
jgi:uncharacterized membrane protein YbaN (DUF454 family)